MISSKLNAYIAVDDISFKKKKKQTEIQHQQRHTNNENTIFAHQTQPKAIKLIISNRKFRKFHRIMYIYMPKTFKCQFIRQTSAFCNCFDAIRTSFRVCTMCIVTIALSPLHCANAKQPDGITFVQTVLF